jgi:YD repeat-containing protein
VKNYPFHLITGSGKGASYSSLRQIGDIIPAEPLGQAKVRLFYNIASFNLTIADRMLTFPEFKETVVLGYYFNNQSPAASAWRLPVKSFVPPDMADAKQIMFTEADGHETVYTLNPSSTSQKMYFAPGLINGTPYLVYDDQNYQWFWYHPGAQVSERYNKYGKLVERTDIWGNKIAFDYTDPVNGVLQSVTGPSGNQYLIDRSDKSDGGRLERIRVKRPSENYGSYIQSYDFDKNGLLITSSASLNGRDLSTVYQTQYHYAVIDPLLLDSIRQDDGTLLQLAYDTYTQNNATAYRLATFYLPAADGQTRTDFTYSSGKVGVEVRGAWKANFYIDSQSRLIQKDQYVSYYDAPKVIETTRYDYASDGQIQKITCPNTGVESFVYSPPFGLLTRHSRPNGQQADYVYENDQNRPLLQSTTVNLPDSKTPVITYTVYQRLW